MGIWQMACRELSGWTGTPALPAVKGGNRAMSGERATMYYFARDKIAVFAYNSHQLDRERRRGRPAFSLWHLAI